MATPKKRAASKSKPVWERGYFSHSYWRGRDKVGSVKLGPKDEWDGIYRWEAGHHFGECSSLPEAKQAVEQVVAFGASQIELFGGEPDSTLKK